MPATNTARTERLPEHYVVFGDHPITHKTIEIAITNTRNNGDIETKAKRDGYTNVHTSWVC